MAEEGQLGLEKATELINSGQVSEALEMVRSVLLVAPSNLDARLIEAIALSQLGNVSDASEAFAKAVELGPNSVKAHFNSAVHEYNVGNLSLAKSLADRTLELDRDHSGAKSLLERMSAAAPATGGMSNYQRIDSTQFEPAYEGVSFIQKMGTSWVVLGWILAVASAAFFLRELVGLLQHLPEIQEAMGKQDMSKMQDLNSSIAPFAYQMAGLAIRICSIFWVLLDIINRRGSFMWLIGHIPCSCLGFGFITQPLYLLFGRK